MTLRLKLPSMWILRAWDGTIFSGWGCEPLAVQLSWVSGIVMNLALSLYLVLSFNWEERGCLRHNFPRFWFTSNHVGPRHSLIIRACKGLRFPVSIWKLLSSTVLRIYLHFFFWGIMDSTPLTVLSPWNHQPWKATLTSPSLSLLHEDS